MSKKLEVKFQYKIVLTHIKLFLHRDKSKIRLYKYGGVFSCSVYLACLTLKSDFRERWRSHQEVIRYTASPIEQREETFELAEAIISQNEVSFVYLSFSGRPSRLAWGYISLLRSPYRSGQPPCVMLGLRAAQLTNKLSLALMSIPTIRSIVAVSM